MTDNQEGPPARAHECIEQQQARIAGLFDAIKHGDQQHEDWLRKAIVDHFAGREVERPKGSGNREIIERQQARIAGLEADLATQIQIGVTDAEEMDQLLERAEAAESANAQAGAREAELVGLVNRLVENAEAFFQINEKDRCPWRVVRFDAPKILAVTPDRIMAAAEVLTMARRMILEHDCDEVAHPLCWQALEEAVRRLDQPETG